MLKGNDSRSINNAIDPAVDRVMNQANYESLSRQQKIDAIANEAVRLAAIRRGRPFADENAAFDYAKQQIRGWEL